ncbi:MAG TPA: RsmD family RNA methyltransferase [Bacteroidia bacterium]|jgi:16S rRNA (guanine966-N2)-methyltransferase|nr:RsmD family RNA methyltransferase [Bacteroidia bacterium]
MYIGGGDFKGRKVPSKYLPIRPTTGKAKQALFNILQNHFNFEECQGLDLFCGTGSLTYDLASRGCKQVTAVDISNGCCNFVRKNVKLFEINNVIVVKSDSLSFLRSHAEPFDIIFCDPPYEYPHYPVIHDLVFSRNLLKPEGWLIIEHSKRTSFADHPNFLQQRTYGEVNFSFLAGSPAGK